MLTVDILFPLKFSWRMSKYLKYFKILFGCWTVSFSITLCWDGQQSPHPYWGDMMFAIELVSSQNQYHQGSSGWIIPTCEAVRDNESLQSSTKPIHISQVTMSCFCVLHQVNVCGNNSNNICSCLPCTYHMPERFPRALSVLSQ